MSNKIKGSDGVDRSINQWSDHIMRKTAYADGDDPLSKEIQHIWGDLRNAISEGGDHIETFRQSTGDYFVKALMDCMESGKSVDGTISMMQTMARRMADSLDKAKWTNHGRVRLGRCLIFYMDKYDDIPRNRKELHQFSNGEISMRTISEHLSWFGLEKICATYHKE